MEKYSANKAEKSFDAEGNKLRNKQPSRSIDIVECTQFNLQLMNQQLGGEFFQGNFELKVLKTFWIQTAEQQYLDGECP